MLTLADGSAISCHVLMLAVGVSWTMLPAQGADRFIGSGVYYGAAMTEATHVKGRTVFMVGAGNSAGQAAMFFKDYAERVVMVVRGSSLAAKMSHYLVNRIEATPNIEVRLETEVVACRGDTRLEEIGLRARGNGSVRDEPAEYLFAFLGAAPRTGWLSHLVACDARGFVITGLDLDREAHLRDWPLDREPYMLETNVPGIFACGDARHASIKRVASAVGEGSVSVAFMHRILAER